MAESDFETIVLPGVAMHLDATFFPVLCATWFGTPSVEVVEAYIGWIDRMATRADAEGTKLVLLGDSSRIEGRPGPEIRRAMGKAISGLTNRHPGTLLGGATVIGDPLMRAVISIIVALSRRGFRLTPVRSYDKAVESVREILTEAGIPVPDGLDDRPTPSRPE